MKTSSILAAVAVLAVCAVSHAQSPVFGQRTYAGMYTYNHADLNNDGREDLINHTQTGFEVELSTGPATYAAPVSYNVPDGHPAGTVSLDLNNDGKLDEIAFDGFATGFYEYINQGDGALKLQSTYTLANIQAMVVGDFNHDGYPDLAALTVGPGNGGTLNILFNNKSGGFTAGPTTITAILGQMSVGDFDGDGAADIALSGSAAGGNDTYLYFGNNTGNFTVVNATTGHQAYYYLMDIDGDGKSDLVGAAVAGQDGEYETYYQEVFVIYGNQFRNVIEQSIPLNGYAIPWLWGSTAPENSPSVDVADFNGDGLRDFAIVEAQNSNGIGPRTLDVKLGSDSRSWGNEIPVYTNSELDPGVAAIRDTDALKPGLLVDTFANNTQTAQLFTNDSSSGYFGGCEYPDTAIGINVCSPDTYDSTSATFSASAAGQTTMRKVEIWVDGVKKYEEIAKHDYSHYGLMDVTVTLSSGTHDVTIIGAGYDNLEVKKSYTITVK